MGMRAIVDLELELELELEGKLWISILNAGGQNFPWRCLNR